MDYYIDTEFLEGKQDKRILGFKYGETKPTIDLISIGIVTEDNDSFSKKQGLSDKTIKGREYYAISKDFNLYEAWNRYDEKINNDYNPSKEESHYNPMYIKEYWIRENVLLSIWNELSHKEYIESTNSKIDIGNGMTYNSLRQLIQKYGKTNKQIANGIIEFVYKKEDILFNHRNCKIENIGDIRSKIKFYGYYSAYDHVVLCQLFGTMNKLPKGFPMYTIDLQQTKDEVEHKLNLPPLKEHFKYPKQTNEHNALSDAKWNLELHKF